MYHQISNSIYAIYNPISLIYYDILKAETLLKKLFVLI